MKHFRAMFVCCNYLCCFYNFCQLAPTIWTIPAMHTWLSGQYFHWGSLWHVLIPSLLFSGCYCVCILTWYYVCLCVCLGGVGVLWGCVCVGVGEGGTALQPDILGTAGWRCWPTCSLLSSAGSSRISAAASPHKATLCNPPRAHKYNCNQERREEGGGKMGQWWQKEEKGSDCSGLCAPVLLKDDNVSLSIFRGHALLPATPPPHKNNMIVRSHLHICLYAKIESLTWLMNIIWSSWKDACNAYISHH